MTDVFLCTCASPVDPIRWHLFQAVSGRWMVECNLILRSIAPESIQEDMTHGGNALLFPIAVDCDLKAFQGARRTFADDNAASSIYVVCDDDCMPLGKDFLARGVKLMEEHPAYAVIAARLLPESPEVWGRITLASKAGADDVIDGAAAHLTSGGINFVRKGPLTDILPRKGEMFDDSHQTAALRAKGWKVGIARNLYTNHFGAGLSTIWPDDYNGAKTNINEY